MSYFCEKCGETFDIPEECGDGWNEPRESVSPCCGANYNEGKRCSRCDELHSENDEEFYCPDCSETIATTWNEKTNQEKFSICVHYLKLADSSLHQFLSEFEDALTTDPINTTIIKFTIDYVLPEGTIDDDFIKFLVETEEF